MIAVCYTWEICFVQINRISDALSESSNVGCCLLKLEWRKLSTKIKYFLWRTECQDYKTTYTYHRITDMIFCTWNREASLESRHLMNCSIVSSGRISFSPVLQLRVIRSYPASRNRVSSDWWIFAIFLPISAGFPQDTVLALLSFSRCLCMTYRIL